MVFQEISSDNLKSDDLKMRSSVTGNVGGKVDTLDKIDYN